MTTQQAKQIPITSLLQSLGHQPRTGRQIHCHWYISPMRNDGYYTFKVNTTKNTFFDKIENKGGNILDLVMMLENTNLSGALKYLDNFTPKINATPITQATQEPNQAAIKLHRVKPLNNAALTQYLESRFIDVDTAKAYLQEVYYFIDDKHYFALGFPNRSKGYEVRNKYFKGCVGAKDISHHANGHPTLSIFEGFTDFLSLLTLKGISQLKSDVLVLNSVSLVSQVPLLINQYQYRKVFTFLDNDKAGNRATQNIQDIIPTQTMNHIYSQHKDLNEHLAQFQTQKTHFSQKAQK